LALFGSATLYAWPDTYSEIEQHFTDTTLIPQEVFPEYGRAREFWATYTTSLGAVLHEFGHCIGLDHPQNPSAGDIMQRGFDYINRLAVTYEPWLGNINPNDSVSPPVMPDWTDADTLKIQSNSWTLIMDTGGGSGGPVLLPGKLSASPNSLVLFSIYNQTETLSSKIKISLSWLDIGWTAQVNGSLPLFLDKTLGVNGEDINIILDPSGYDLGDYEGTITITASDNTIQNSPLSIPIKLIVVDKINMIYLPEVTR